MSSSDKTLMAIEEKRRWEERELELLRRIESIRKEKHELKKKVKNLKDEITSLEETLMTLTKDERDFTSSIERMGDSVR